MAKTKFFVFGEDEWQVAIDIVMANAEYYGIHSIVVEVIDEPENLEAIEDALQSENINYTSNLTIES